MGFQMEYEARDFSAFSIPCRSPIHKPSTARSGLICVNGSRATAGASYLGAWELFCVGTKCWLSRRTFQSARHKRTAYFSRARSHQASGLLQSVLVAHP